MAKNRMSPVSRPMRFASTSLHPSHVLRVATYNIHKGVRGVGPNKRLEIHNLGLGIEALRDWSLSNVYEIYAVWRGRYAPGVTHNTEHVFGLTVPAGIAVTLNPREHLRHQWLSHEAAAQRCFSPSNAAAIRELPRFVQRLAQP